MKPGLELDRLVAERIMDGKEASYSTDTAAALEVMEAIRNKKEMWSSITFGFSRGRGACYCQIGHKGSTQIVIGYHSHTAPHAICIASLRAMGVNI